MNRWGRKWEALWQKIPLIRVFSEMELWFWVHFVEIFFIPVSCVKNHLQSAAALQIFIHFHEMHNKSQQPIFQCAILMEDKCA
jgi:hypothetical protein